ncbi:MAG TPA: hypothetical protein VGW78_02635 [Candidatus Babeliales bacterium]|jgi:hypothetical protein|nr:hypothetical protein [Candidatus Babeliales bacterium]
MKYYIPLCTIIFGISITSYASWKDQITFSNVLTMVHLVTMVGIKVYDELQKDHHQQERFKVLTQQQILLNKQGLQKGDQEVEENTLFLQKKALEIEKEKYQNQLFKIQTQATSCEQYIEALKKITEILPIVPEEKRLHLNKELEQDIERLVRTKCGFKEIIVQSPNIVPKIL